MHLPDVLVDVLPPGFADWALLVPFVSLVALLIVVTKLAMLDVSRKGREDVADVALVATTTVIVKSRVDSGFADGTNLLTTSRGCGTGRGARNSRRS